MTLPASTAHFYVFRRRSIHHELVADFPSLHCGRFRKWSQEIEPQEEEDYRFIAGPKGQVPKVGWDDMLPVARARKTMRPKERTR